jgi:hypothetical protein
MTPERMESTERDPRSIVTPHAFRVAPELLGTPLARPWRRAAAMLIDLALVGILALLGGRVFWIVAAIVLFRIARASTGGVFGSRFARFAVRAVATAILVTTAAVWFVTCANPEVPIPGVEGPDGAARVRVLDLLRAPGRFEALASAESDSAAAVAAEALVSQLLALGTSADDLRGMVAGLVDDGTLSEARGDIAARVIDDLATDIGSDEDGFASARSAGDEPMEATADSLVLLYAAAVQAGDSAEKADLRGPLIEAIARERIARLNARVGTLENEQDELEEQLAEERRVPGIRRILQGLLDDLGLSFGWLAVYFTAFVALWSGHTPGKRALGIRIVRTNGEPVSWWVAFERFGGYGASVFTGMLGFFEMLWDANRQALHDKLARTVVIREVRKAA